MQMRLLSRFINQEIDVADASLYLRAPNNNDFEQWLRLRTDSQDFLRPWEPRWPEDDLTTIGYRRRLKSYVHQKQTGSARTYFLFRRSDDQLIGGISLTRITHGVVRSATLGYWMGVHYAGHGWLVSVSSLDPRSL